MPNLFIVCGVSASGKSTIGRLLAAKLNGIFLEGDDFHPPENLTKMSKKIALSDEDRRGWITAMVNYINTIEAYMPVQQNPEPQDIVLACSALTPFVQSELKQQCSLAIEWIILELPERIAMQRSMAREHFMPPDLIASQYAAWSPPKNGIIIDAAQPPEHCIEQIIHSISPINLPNT